MRTKLVVFSTLILLGLNSCSQDLQKLKASEADPHKVEIAQSFANEFFGKLKQGSSYQFEDNAIAELKTHLNEENQRALYQQLNEQFGDFQSLSYAETWVQSGDLSMQINRLKGDFDRSRKKVEIRVVIDGSNRIAGFWVKPWSDMLN